MSAERVWVEDRLWRLSDGDQKCRFTGCEQRAVARLYRGGKGPWWHYCADHLYGRRIVGGGRFEIEVAAGSPAAERGFTGDLPEDA